MCGRYTFYDSDQLLDEYDFIKEKSAQVELALGIRDNFNVAPGQVMPVIIRGEQSNEIEFMEWGLIPAWSKEPHTKLKLINARQEGLFEKPMWRRLVNQRRCVVPARGFYEWCNDGDEKQPFYITPIKSKFFNFAGLWDEWIDKSLNQTIKTFSIITTNPNKEMSVVHNRMPSILDKNQMKLWLSPLELTEEQSRDILCNTLNNTLKIVKVSKSVNNVKRNTADLIYPLNN